VGRALDEWVILFLCSERSVAMTKRKTKRSLALHLIPLERQERIHKLLILVSGKAFGKSIS
jgi:hypothetical protein